MIQKDRAIYLCDCDSFFASVEEAFHPEYKNVPFAVAGDPDSRHGIILAKNQMAKKLGIKTAETINDAKRKCPNLLLAPPRHNTYSEFCNRFNAIYEQYTDQVERVSIDESFMDVTGSLHLFGGDPIKLANEIRLRVEREIGITISIGISWNKIFAKVASDINKPNGVCFITRDNYKDIIWTLPVSDMYGVGSKARAVLNKHCIKTIGELAALGADSLKLYLGEASCEMLHRFANGLDDEQVSHIGEQQERKSLGKGRTFKRDLKSENDIRVGVISLADYIAFGLRHENKKCYTIQITIKDTLLKSIQRQKKLVNPTYLASEIVESAMNIIKESWTIGKPIRMLTITAQNLVASDHSGDQLNLFVNPNTGKNKKSEKLELAMDKIRDKYGLHSIQAGSIYNNDLGISDHDTEDELV